MPTGQQSSPQESTDLRTAAALVAVLDGVRAARTAGGVIEAIPGPLVTRLGVYAARAIGSLRGAPVVMDASRDPLEGVFFGARLDDVCAEAMGEDRPVEHRFTSRQLGLEVAFIAVPIHDASTLTVGAVGVACAVHGAGDSRRFHATLDAVAKLVELAPTWSSSSGSRAASADEESAVNDAAQLGKAAGYEDEVALAFALTNNLSTRMDCELVALGVADGPTIKLLSVSGLEDVRAESPAVEALSQAMAECVDLNLQASAPVSELAGERPAPALLTAWQVAVGGSVAVIPVESSDGARGVVALRRAPGLFFEEAELERVAELVGPYLPGLELLRRARRGLLRHTLDVTLGQVAALRRPGAWGRRAIATAGTLFTLWFLFGSMGHRLAVPCEVRSTEVRHLAAPFEGVLRSAPFTAGQRVREGDVLATFDTAFEDLERAHLLAELEVLEVDLRQALARDDALGQRRLDEQRTSLEAQLELAEHKISRASLVAPFDGVVLTGDHRDRIGDTLTQGDTLFELAPGDGWRVELFVPEEFALEVAVGQTGSFSTRARPEVRHGFEIERLGGAIETVDGAAVLRLEGEVTDQAPWVRPGMAGSAKLSVRSRAPWRKLADPMLDWLRLRFVL